MMVLYVSKWNINPNKVEEYGKWAQSAVQRLLAAPGVVEFRAYRGAAGGQGGQVIVTLEFADMAGWAAWQSEEGVQQVIAETFVMGLNVTSELWGPSPVVPQPIRPGK